MSSSQAAALAVDVAEDNQNKLGADFADIFAASFHPTQKGQYEMYLALSADLPSGWQ